MMEFIVILVICNFFESNANPGKRFLLAFPQNSPSSTVPVDILITSTVAHTNSSVNLTFNAPTNFVPPSEVRFTLPPLQRYHLKVDASIRMPVGILKDDRSMIIESTENIMVSVYSNHGSNGDAYLAMPTTEFGKEFYTINYDYKNKATSCFIVMAAPEKANIKVKLPEIQEDANVSFEGRYYGNGETIGLQLLSNQVFQLQTSGDLTGTYITSDRPIFVLSGQNRTTVLHDSCLSHMMDVVPPVDRVSNQYVTVNFPDIGLHYRDDIYRIVATERNTYVTIGGETSISLEGSGNFHEFRVGGFEYLFINSDKPIYIAQLSSSNFNKSAKFGDPSLLFLTPLPATRSSFYFSVFIYNMRVFLNIIIDSHSMSGLELDGGSVTTTWVPVSGKPDLVVGLVEINTTNAIVHTLKHVDGVQFLAYVQGGETCEAYAFPLQYVSARLKPPCSVPPATPGDGKDNNCDENIDEEVCCIDQLGSGLEYYNDITERDCSAPAGYTSKDIICCDENHQQFLCHDIQQSTYTNGINRKKYSSTSIEIRVTHSLQCQTHCLTKTTCWGFNYKTVSVTGEMNCQLLVGESYGSSADLNWKYFEVVKSTKYQRVFN